MDQRRIPGRAVVLTVEDEPLVRMMAIELFGDEGFEVPEAADALQALKASGERDDVKLPFTDVERRALPRAGDLPGGAFVSKPCDHGDVMRRVHTMMAG